MGKMIPYFFGSSEAPLYGVYLPPKATARDAGVVLCYPFGQEYMRAHRAYRQLASLLAKKGYHVLRFDYRGTGDSSGDMKSVNAHDWVDDVGEAIREMREVKGLSSVTVLGLRLGALIAGAACAARTDVDRLIVWDPILSGGEYEQELLTEIANEKPSPWGGSSGNRVASDGTVYFNGFPLTASFRDSIRKLSLPDVSLAGVDKVLLAVSHETAEFSKLNASWQTHAGLHYQFTPAPHDWNYVDNFGAILLPQPIIQAIIGSMDGGWMDSGRTG
ncbi:MAG: hypothetical protein JWM78_75 [Verrucomicrobiaceae bacterium]|nr:hypothetical protein [Verrucomicrobiaceae bacterium]